MNKLNIIGISGSPRNERSRTTQIIKSVLNGCEAAGAKIDFVDITKYKINDCMACDECHKVGYCQHKDDFDYIFNKIVNSNGIVMGSPCHMYHMTSQLKKFCDRLTRAIHCQLLKDKYGVVISTSGLTGHEETAIVMEAILHAAGVQTVDKITCVLPNGMLSINAPILDIAEELGHTLVAAINNKDQYLEQLIKIEKLSEYFKEVIGIQKENWIWEYQYLLNKNKKF